MPRPKKNTPTVATTEPDINVTPEVGNPRTPIVVNTIPEGAPATVARVEQVPPGSGGPTLEAILAEKDATIAEQSARIADLEQRLAAMVVA